MSNKVVPFPIENKRNVVSQIPESEEEVNTRKQLYHKQYIDFLAGEVVGQIIHMMAHEGFELNTPEVEPNIYLLVDSFYSMLYKSLGYDHPLHEIAHQHFFSEGIDKSTPI